MIHPFLENRTEGVSSIIFGDYNIIEEAVLTKTYLKNLKIGKEKIGNYNHFKIGAHVENASVQDYNIIDLYLISNYYNTDGIKEEKILKKGSVLLPKIN